jgi:hypothetical protein
VVLLLVVDIGRHLDLAPRPVEARHLAHAVLEAVPVRLRQVVDRMRVQVHRAGRDLVQVGLPEVRAGLLDQGHLGLALLAQLVAQARGQLETTGAASNDDDPVRRGVLHSCPRVETLVIT